MKIATENVIYQIIYYLKGRKEITWNEICDLVDPEFVNSSDMHKVLEWLKERKIILIGLPSENKTKEVIEDDPVIVRLNKILKEAKENIKTGNKNFHCENKLFFIDCSLLISSYFEYVSAIVFERIKTELKILKKDIIPEKKFYLNYSDNLVNRGIDEEIIDFDKKSRNQILIKTKNEEVFEISRNELVVIAASNRNERFFYKVNNDFIEISIFENNSKNIETTTIEYGDFGREITIKELGDYLLDEHIIKIPCLMSQYYDTYYPDFGSNLFESELNAIKQTKMDENSVKVKISDNHFHRYFEENLVGIEEINNTMFLETHTGRKFELKYYSPRSIVITNLYSSYLFYHNDIDLELIFPKQMSKETGNNENNINKESLFDEYLFLATRKTFSKNDTEEALRKKDLWNRANKIIEMMKKEEEEGLSVSTMNYKVRRARDSRYLFTKKVLNFTKTNESFILEPEKGKKITVVENDIYNIEDDSEDFSDSYSFHFFIYDESGEGKLVELHISSEWR